MAKRHLPYNGQIQVMHGIPGLYPRVTPTPVKRCLSPGVTVYDAPGQYVSEVKGCSFHSQEHSFVMGESILEELVTVE